MAVASIILSGTLPAAEPSANEQTCIASESVRPCEDNARWRERLAAEGLTFRLGLTQVFQSRVSGELDVRRDKSDYSGRYDLDLALCLEKMFGVRGGSVHVLGQGGWSDGLSVGSLFGLNTDAWGDRALDVTQLYYQQNFLDDKLQLRLGKIWTFGGFLCRGSMVAFDCNDYASDETSQFLNGAFKLNPTIPFPDAGLGATVYVRLTDWWYAAAGVTDAQGRRGAAGFRTAFDGRQHYSYIAEIAHEINTPTQYIGDNIRFLQRLLPRSETAAREEST